MDVIVIDCPTKWGMLLSRKWEANAGGNIQINWSYADIHVTLNYTERLFCEKMLHNVENVQQLKIEPLYLEVSKLELGKLALMDDHDE